MHRKQYRIFIGIFLFLIFSVPAIQAIVEIRRNNSIQALDILTDASVTPYRRAVLLHGFAEKLSGFSDSATREVRALRDTSFDNAGVRQLIDEARVSCGEMKKTAITINRHVTLDSNTGIYAAIDSFSTLLSKLQQSGLDRSTSVSDAVTLDGLKRVSDLLIAKFKKPRLYTVPLMIAENCKYIFWNDRYLRPYEKEMENGSVFAVFLRPWIQYIRYVFFGDLGEKGMAGKNGWFFFKPDVDFLIRPYILDRRSIVVDPNDKAVGENPIAAICTFKKQLQQAGIELLVVIIPGKPDIYPDCLAHGLSSKSAATFGHSQRTIEELRRQGVETVDLFAAFTAARGGDAQSGDSLYLQKDTHWKARGVRSAAYLVAERIKKYPWYIPGAVEYVIDTVVVDRLGDVAVMSTLPAFKVRDLSLSFATEKTACYKVYQVVRDSLGNELERVAYKDDFHSSPILLLGDSFSRIYQTDEPRSAGWISHIAFELKQPIASVVNDGGASTLVRQSLARRAGLLKGKKLVVWEIVERDFRYGEEGWKDIPLKISQN